MKLVKDYGCLTATIVDEPDGISIYVTNKITNSEHLSMRLDYSDPLTNLYVYLNKIKNSANELNENFKKL